MAKATKTFGKKQSKSKKKERYFKEEDVEGIQTTGKYGPLDSVEEDPVRGRSLEMQVSFLFYGIRRYASNNLCKFNA